MTKIFRRCNRKSDNQKNAKVLSFAAGKRNHEIAKELKISWGYLYKQCRLAWSENNLSGTGVSNILDWIEIVMRAFFKWRGIYGITPIMARVMEIGVELIGTTPSPDIANMVFGVPPLNETRVSAVSQNIIRRAA